LLEVAGIAEEAPEDFKPIKFYTEFFLSSPFFFLEASEFFKRCLVS